MTGYADASFSGTAWTYSTDTTDLTAGGSNDMISSLRVTSGS
ncbi:hypothetical protein [Streptomyces sp. NPDC003554]